MEINPDKPHINLTKPVFASRIFKHGDSSIGQSIKWGYEIRKLDWVPINKSNRYAHWRKFADAIIEVGFNAPSKKHAKAHAEAQIAAFERGEVIR